ncbi:MAG: hypothetical protein JNK11_01600 [Alphaproteobacteria bacterium]|nr:hypothetical protein [Alphaproteobacteria bacterium]
MEFIGPLLAKMAVTAALVVSASVAAERSGPFLGGIIISLPVSAGPGFVFLALKSDDAFVAASALNGLASQGATCAFILAFTQLATRINPLAALLAGSLAWLAVALAIARWEPGFLPALAFALACFAVAIPLAQRPDAAADPAKRRAGFPSLLGRALLTGTLIASVVTASELLGSMWTGLLLCYPIALTTLSLILILRHGGALAAATLARTLPPLVVFPGFMVAVHLLALPVGSGWALVAAFAFSIIGVAAIGAAGHLIGQRRAARRNSLVPAAED